MGGRSAAPMGAAPSSPIRKNTRLMSPPRHNKERRNPSITPRKFRRFFTPRPRPPSQFPAGHISPARKALRELASPDLSQQQFNQRYQTPAPSSPLRAPSEVDQIQDENIVDGSRAKRRKTHHTPHDTPGSSPIWPQPLDLVTDIEPRPRQPSLLSPIQSLESSSQELLDSDDSDDEDLVERRPVRRLAFLPTRGFAGQLLQRELGCMPRAGRSYMTYPSCGLYQNGPPKMNWLLTSIPRLEDRNGQLLQPA
jgi:hypothetical protein